MSKLYKYKIVRAFNSRARIIPDRLDILHDKKLVCANLGEYVPSQHRGDMGATGSQSTPYYALRKMIGADTFSDSDVFADIGCGKGRVLAYMAAEYGFKGKIRGVELNPGVASMAADWAKQFDNVEIIAGDAFRQDLSDITVMYLGRPFETEFFKKFVDKFESEIHHPVTVYYWVDQQSGSYLKGRKGWTREKRIKIYYGKCLPLASVPQGFSKWTYNPE